MPSPTKLLPNLAQRQSFVRPQWQIFGRACFNDHDRILMILHLLTQHSGEQGIIYTLTRRHSEQLVNLINRLRPESPKLYYYHAGVAKKKRQRLQAAFARGKFPVLVATSVLGPGINLTAVRFVIHAQMSVNLHNYYQEIGRVGRDGRVSRVYTLWTPHDLVIASHFATTGSWWQRYSKRRDIKKVRAYLHTRDCRQQFLARSFGEKTARPCGQCDQCRREKLSFTRRERERLQQLQAARQVLANKGDYLPQSLITDTSLAYLAVLGPLVPAALSHVPGLGRGSLALVKKLLVDAPE